MITMTDLPALPDTLPDGWTAAEPHPADAVPPRPHPAEGEPAPRRTDSAPAMSGALTAVTSRTGTPVTIHRADYTVQSPRGGWAVHGYAWRCPCRRLALGYGPENGFAQALADARDHECGVSG